MAELERLREENALLKAEIERLRGLPQSNGVHDSPGAAEAAADAAARDSGEACPMQRPAWDGANHGLSKEQIARYSRQVILHSFGVHAQSKLCRGSVLIVGAGGLGSPAALYLAAAGVGRIGIVDRDAVELSNIHRQVIHREASVGQHKALSAAEACRALNSSLTVETHLDGFTPANAVRLVSAYDAVVDASDNAPTRYLISDACCVARRPLVSGAAIGTDGQLTVYCHGEDGPCYRCLFPVAPRPESCARCVDAGVLGPVPGVVGTLQAVEAIKILAGLGEPMSRKLLLLDALSSRFHTVKLRARSPDCLACGTAPAITASTLPTYDYTAFTGLRPTDAAPTPLTLIPRQERLSATELQAMLASESPYVLLDVRPPEQFAVGHLPGAMPAPFKVLDKHLPSIREQLEAAAAAAASSCSGQQRGEEEGAAAADSTAHPPPPLFVVCRRGNDSQRAVARLRQLGIAHAVDLVGGMEAWAREVDPSFPVY